MARDACADLLIESACRPLRNSLAFEQIYKPALAWGADGLGLVAVLY